MTIGLIIVAVVLVIGTIVGITAWMDRLRRDSMKVLAEKLGLEFAAEGSTELLARLSHFPLMSTGRSRKLSTLIQGDSGDVSISIFDYQYVTGSGQHSHTHRQSVAALFSLDLQCPDFLLRPESALDKLGSLVGMADIDFDSHPKFSGMFLLKGSNEPAIRNYFNPEMLSWFENHKGLSVEAVPGAMIIYRPGKRLAAGDVQGFLSLAYELYGICVDSH